jgi:5-formyltetrahydrofolate cyclo-ligase
VTDRDDQWDGAPEDAAEKAVTAAKRAARARARSARDCLDRPICKEASAEAALNLMGLTELASVGVILAYAALPAEIDPLQGVSALRRRGAKIAYPRIESPGILGIHIVDHELDLVAGPFGLAQPRTQAPRANLYLIDAVLVPGVAFDVRGMRLGYGGGYYDRLLPCLRPDCLRIGVAFDEQILAEIPVEEHDEIVDLIVTQTRVIRPGTRLGC